VSCDPFSVRSILHCLETSVIYLYVCVENVAFLKLYVDGVRQCHSWNSKLIDTDETNTVVTLWIFFTGTEWGEKLQNSFRLESIF
jgi:hypothetical protein